MLRNKSLLVVVLLSAALVLAACGGGQAPADDDNGAGEDNGQQGLVIEDVWAHPGEPGDHSAVYMTITNKGDADDTLVAAAADVAMTELHESMEHEDHTVSMEHLHEVPIPAGETVVFEPGGLHIMLMDLNEELAAGDTFQLTLTFAEAGEVVVEVTVR